MAANPMAAMESAVGEFSEMVNNPAAYMEKMIKKMMDVGVDKMKSVIEKQFAYPGIGNLIVEFTMAVLQEDKKKLE